MVEIPSNRKDLGEEFEFESNLSKQELINFLKEIVSQLEKEDEITVSMVGSEATFPFREPINIDVECEYEKHGERELEIELEFRER